MATEGALSITTTSERVLRRCFPELQSFLNCDAAIPYLAKYELITRQEIERLMLEKQTNSDKVNLIVQWLPSKPDFVKKFLACLRESAEKEGVPAHRDLALKLEEELRALSETDVRHKRTTIDAKHGVTTEIVTQRLPHEQTDCDGEENAPLTEECGIGSVQLRHCKKWLLCYISLSFTAILALVLLIVLATTPTVSDDVIPSDLSINDTVEIHFNLDSGWLSQATLSTAGGCNGPLFIIRKPCSDLRERYTYTIAGEIPNNPEMVYLLPGSVINFTVPAGVDTDVWVFTDSERANDYSRNSGSYDCTNPPPDTEFCFNTRLRNGTFPLPVSKAAYYFIRCPSPYQIFFSFNRILYNFEDISRDFKPDINVSSLGRVAQLNKPFQFSESCVLLHANTRLSCGPSGTGFLQPMEVQRREDILLFPGLLLAISLTALAIIVCIHCACVCRWKRGTMTAMTELE